MDKTDIAILRALQEDGRASAQQLSEQVGLSPAPVWRRVKALESAGVIQGYSAQVDRSKVGLGGCMFAQISLERHSAETVANFERSVRDAPEILECYSVTGDFGFPAQDPGGEPRGVRPLPASFPVQPARHPPDAQHRGAARDQA